eukprot:COSAG01_NODE_39079_length_481_cov_1.031414_1_plen_123_part_10
MSAERMVHHQNAMGLVFHTATFSDKAALDAAIESLRMDTSWARRCQSLTRPPEVDTIPKLVTHDGAKPSDGNAWAVLRYAQDSVIAIISHLSGQALLCVDQICAVCAIDRGKNVADLQKEKPN